jgi:cell division protein FtsQ
VFALRVIQVEGEVTRNSVSTIRANAAPRLAGNFFTTDLQKGKSAFESVPWVRQAIVRRVWPNRLAVRLEEHRPAALWSSDATTDKIVNTYGEVFEANLGDVEDDSLPTFKGPEGSSVAMLLMLNRLRPVFAIVDAQIDGLTLSVRGSWRVELDTGAEVELGRGTDDEVVARTERFVSTLTQVTQRYQRPLEYADLRHRDGYAVRLKGITTVVTPPKEQRK